MKLLSKKACSFVSEWVSAANKGWDFLHYSGGKANPFSPSQTHRRRLDRFQWKSDMQKLINGFHNEKEIVIWGSDESLCQTSLQCLGQTIWVILRHIVRRTDEPCRWVVWYHTVTPPCWLYSTEWNSAEILWWRQEKYRPSFNLYGVCGEQHSYLERWLPI